MEQEISSNRKAMEQFKSLQNRHGFGGVSFPYSIRTTFVPPDIPQEHSFREFHDDRAYTDEAPSGFWEIEVWDLNNDILPAAMSAFVATDNGVYCDRLSVEQLHHSKGLGQIMIDMGQRLWGAAVIDATHFTDQQENFWSSRSRTDTAL